MSDEPMANERFAALVQAFAGTPGVTPPSLSGRSSFGSNALKVDNKIFAMLVQGWLVLKLPAKRVASLIEEGAGLPFDAGKGKPMKEWLKVAAESEERWLALAQEALVFVGKR